jgi:O-antigen/teichoic acid export membrane protein
LGLFDQVVVSAMNFLALIIVARNSELKEVGLYVLAMSILVVLISLQDSVVTRPYAVRLLKPAGSTTEHAGSALLLTLILVAIVFACTVIFGFAFQIGDVPFTFPITIGAVAIAILVREFARRHAFSAYVAERALKLDLLSSAVSLVALFALATRGVLTAQTALLSLGLGSTLAVGLWWLRHAREFSFSRISFAETTKQNWLLGKWFSIGQIAMQFQGYANHWLILVLLGAAATGIYGEAMSVVALANPFIYGVLNLLMPKSVRKLHHEGRASLLRQTRIDMAGIGFLMSLFVLVIIFFGKGLLDLFYHQPDLHPSVATVMTLLALGSLVGAVGAPLTISMQSEERGHELAAVAIACLIFAIASSALLISWYGMIGAGWAFLLTEAFSFILRSYLMFVKTGRGT